MRNILLYILTCSVLLTGFSQAIDIISFRIQQYYISNDRQVFTKGTIVYCGGEAVLHKELKDHKRSSDNINERGKKEIQLYGQHHMPLPVRPATVIKDIPIPARIGHIIRRPAEIFHPPRRMFFSC